MSEITSLDQYRTDPLMREALAWVVQLTSGAATADHIDAVQQWRAQSSAHNTCFIEAVRLWKAVGVAALTSQQGIQQKRTTNNVNLSRRAMIGGALAAAVTGVMVVRPPYSLWPSIGETIASLGADYKTQPGKQQQIDLGHGVAVRLNTRSSVALNQVGTSQGFELIAGEAFVDTASASRNGFTVSAGTGKISVTAAQANVRRDRDKVCVTCLSGEVIVQIADLQRTIPAQSQITYSTNAIGNVVRADVEAIVAWRKGLIVFRDWALSDVVDEVNRYRDVRIILANDSLASKRVSGTFHIDRLDDVLKQVRQVYGAETTQLPGGIVLLS